MTKNKITSAVVAGCGTMGQNLAQIFAEHGIEVTLWNHNKERLATAYQALQNIEKATNSSFLQHIQTTTDDNAFASAQFVIETIVENIDIKLAFLRKISALTPADCLIATNTSGLSITKLATATAHPEHFAGMHWINPPTLIPLVEVIQGEKTSPETMDSVFDLACFLGKHPIRTKDVPGFLLNRLQLAILREAFHLVENGTATADDVDAAVKYGLGLRYACVGPFETVDLGGVDIFRSISSYLFADLDDRKDVPPILQKLCNEGALGVKAGKGFYDYSGDKATKTIERRDKKLIAISEVLSNIDKE